MVQVVEQVTWQYVDPAVTKEKYDQELDLFIERENDWRKKGVFLIKDEFPLCEFLFLVPTLFTISSVIGIRIDFTNYDADPPSVKFINPYDGKLIPLEQIPLQFKGSATEEFIAQNRTADPSEGINICISIKGGLPFICHPGFREYHEHPLHTDDSWLVRRAEGEGKLYRILQVLYDHSTKLVESMRIRKIGKQDFGISFIQRKPQ